MNRNDYLELFDEVDDKFILEAIQSREPARPVIRKNYVLLIAAAVSIALLLVGCGIVYMLNMQNLKLEDREWTDPYVYTNGPVIQRIISTGGPQGTANYQAAKEWQDFAVSYARTHDWDESFVCPPEYENYQIYSQEMADRLSQILKTYNLKPLGPKVVGENETGLLNYLGIDSILLPDAPAEVRNLSVTYFEGGKLSTHCCIQMEDGPGRWPYETHTHCTFTPKGYFDNGLFILDNPDEWKEWNYTTASGETFLILYNPNYYEAYAICDRGDRMVSVNIQTAKTLYMDYPYFDELMSEEQVEQLLDVFDFSLMPKPGDPALLTGLPAGYDASRQVQSADGYTIELKEAVSDGNLAWVTLGITVPEDIIIPNRTEDGHTFWNLGFGNLQLQLEGSSQFFRESFRERDDGDGLDNTLEYVFTWTRDDFDTLMGSDTHWTLTLENMHQQLNNPGQDNLEIAWEKDSLWKFDFTFDGNCDYRALEFVSAPIEIPAVIGEAPDGSEEWGTVTVTALTLRRHSVSLLLEEPVSYGDLHSQGTDPMVVLKDGTGILLQGYNSIALDQSNTSCQRNLRPTSPIPLDEVDHILLTDGTKLYPQ